MINKLIKNLSSVKLFSVKYYDKENILHAKVKPTMIQARLEQKRLLKCGYVVESDIEILNSNKSEDELKCDIEKNLSNSNVEQIKKEAKEVNITSIKTLKNFFKKN